MKPDPSGEASLAPSKHHGAGAGERARAAQVLATFDAIIRGEIRIGPFDFIVSSFAIHHLYDAEKFVLFQRLIEALQPGGWLMNIDVTLPDQNQ